MTSNCSLINVTHPFTTANSAFLFKKDEVTPMVLDNELSQ